MEREVPMKRILIFVMLLGLMAPVAWTKSLVGVTMDDSVMVDGHTLKLNGLGLRKKLWIKVYVGGLYLEHPTTNGKRAAESKEVKKMVMRFMTNKATKSKMDGGWDEGFEENYAHYNAVKARVEKFKNFFGDMKDGDVVEMTLIPGKGTTVVINGVEKGSIDGDDFQEALVKVWTGDEPPTEDFRDGILGG